MGALSHTGSWSKNKTCALFVYLIGVLSRTQDYFSYTTRTRVIEGWDPVKLTTIRRLRQYLPTHNWRENPPELSLNSQWPPEWETPGSMHKKLSYLTSSMTTDDMNLPNERKEEVASSQWILSTSSASGELLFDRRETLWQKISDAPEMVGTL